MMKQNTRPPLQRICITLTPRQLAGMRAIATQLQLPLSEVFRNSTDRYLRQRWFGVVAPSKHTPTKGEK